MILHTRNRLMIHNFIFDSLWYDWYDRSLNSWRKQGISTLNTRKTSPNDGTVKVSRWRVVVEHVFLCAGSVVNEVLPRPWVSRCTGIASGNRLRSLVSSAHYTCKPPLASNSAPSGTLCPKKTQKDTSKGTDINLQPKHFNPLHHGQYLKPDILT